MIRINIHLDIEKIEQDLEEFKDISGLEERENEKKEILCEYLIYLKNISLEILINEFSIQPGPTKGRTWISESDRHRRKK